MKMLKLYVFGCVIFSLVGCSTKETAYNVSTYILNKECETSKNCSGSLDSTYQENEKSNQEYQKLLAQEKETARLKKVQEELKAKEKSK
jgi:hypothetical protein